MSRINILKTQICEEKYCEKINDYIFYDTSVTSIVTGYHRSDKGYCYRLAFKARESFSGTVINLTGVAL